MNGNRLRATTATLAALLLAAAARGQDTGALRFEKEATLGCRLCGGPEELGVVTSLAVRDGLLLLSDRDPPHLRLFSLSAPGADVLGSHGDGPGELRFPLAATLPPEGGVLVVDMRRSRVIRLTDDGRELWSVPLDRFTLAAGFGPGGSGLAFVQGDFRTMQARPARWDTLDRRAVIVAGAHGLPLPPPGQSPLYVSIAVGPDGEIAFGPGDDGHTITVLHPDAVAARTLASDRGPGSYFGIDALRYDPSGRLWVRTGRGPDGETVFDVYGPDRYQGAVTLPVRAAAFLPLDDRLIVVELDDLDIATIGIWRRSP